MKIKRYKQTAYETCLPVCLLLASGQEVSPEEEMRLFIEGIKNRPDNYLLGMVESFVGNYGLGVEIYVDNKYFWKYLNLRKRINDKRIYLLHQPISPEFITKQLFPYLLYLDINLLGVYSHSPHFVVVESQKKQKYSLVDPWSGRRRKIDKEIVYEAIESLRTHLKFCPLLIKVRKETLMND